MNYFLAIGVLVAVVCYGSTDLTTSPQCPNDNILAGTAKCLETYGLGPGFIRFQTNRATAQDLIEACEQQEKFKQAIQCVVNVTAPCASDAITAAYDQAIQDNAAYCGDPRINFECLAGYTRNKSALESCIKLRWNGTEMVNRSVQENMCYSRKFVIQCARELLQPCDDYTGTTIANRLVSASPIVCYFYPHFVD